MVLLELSVLVAEQQGQVMGTLLQVKGFPAPVPEVAAGLLRRWWKSVLVLFSLLSQSLAHVPMYQFPRAMWSPFWLTGQISWVLSMHVDGEM